jgi:hypothetical protein
MTVMTMVVMTVPTCLSVCLSVCQPCGRQICRRLSSLLPHILYWCEVAGIYDHAHSMCGSVAGRPPPGAVWADAVGTRRR